MEKKRPPDPENQDFNTSSTDDKIRTYEAIANAYHAGTQPAIFLTHSFLQDNPILLEEGCLTVNWDRIPGLYLQTDQMLTVSITAQWDKWGWPSGWTMWEPDTRPEHFHSNLAVVLCKGVFDDATDPGLMGKVCHYMTIAQVPDCVQLLPFYQVREAFNRYNEATTRVGLVHLHQSNEIFPDIYFQYYSEHFMIMGLLDPEIRFSTADEFVGGYLVCRHMAVSGWRAHAMLPPGYVLGATRPTPSPMYLYHPGGTGFLAQHPPIHAIFLAPRGKFIVSPGRFCIGEALATEWPFDDALVPWILPEGYCKPKGTVLDFPGGDSQDEDSPKKGSGAAPLTVPETVRGTAQDDADDEDDEGFEMVDDKEVHGDQVVVSILAEKVSKSEDSGLDGKGNLFESEEDDDPNVQEQIKTVLASSGPLGDLQLSESEDESESGSPGGDDDEGDPNETKQYYQDEEDEVAKDSGLKPNSSTTAVMDPPAVPGNPGNPDGSDPGMPAKDTQPTKPIPSKGKGPNSESSSKAPASKSGATTQPSAVAQGVQECMQSTLFAAATLAQATSTEEDMVRRLENYTSLLTGLQNLVVTMASWYEAVTEDI